MEYNNNWQTQYPDYSYQQAAAPNGRKSKKERKHVGVLALICCMLATALLGGAFGGWLTKAYVDRSVAEVQSEAAAMIASASANQDQSTVVP